MFKVDTEALGAFIDERIAATLARFFQGDRRKEPRAKGATKGKARHCPIPGCTNGWRAVSGGFCAEHLKTKAAKAWAAGRGKKAAKKR